MKKKTWYNLLRLLRPRQWIKNLAIFAAITFAGGLFNFYSGQKVFMGFLVFCGLSSAIYIINDIFDVQKDRQHPFKKFRPLAHGDIPILNAFVFAIVLGSLSIWASILINPAFFLLGIVYILLQVFYSSTLKNITVIDILAVATGYILRVYGGELASGYHISVWLLLTTISLSLFLAIGKRRSELTLISHEPKVSFATRATLSHYSERLLDVYTSLFATSTFISYVLFTFLENPKGVKLFFGVFLPDFLPGFSQKKWLMVTIIPVVYGIMRYMQDIYEKHEGESPERVLLSDFSLLTSVILWAILVISIIYLIPS